HIHIYEKQGNKVKQDDSITSERVWQKKGHLLNGTTVDRGICASQLPLVESVESMRNEEDKEQQLSLLSAQINDEEHEIGAEDEGAQEAHGEEADTETKVKELPDTFGTIMRFILGIAAITFISHLITPFARIQNTLQIPSNMRSYIRLEMASTIFSVLVWLFPATTLPKLLIFTRKFQFNESLEKSLMEKVGKKFQQKAFFMSTTKVLDYENTAFRCRLCRNTSHLKASCPFNKNHKSGKKNGSTSSSEWGSVNPDLVSASNFQDNPNNPTFDGKNVTEKNDEEMGFQENHLVVG
ncbi:hypothetical protein KI387_023551, partial [Taxus chinensis]